MSNGRPSIKARVMRLTTVDEGGIPVVGACRSIVTAGFTRVEVSHEYEDGEEFITKNAWGELCINDRDPDAFKNAGVSIEMCQVHADVLGMVASMVPIVSDANVIGAALTEDISDYGFSLETWTRISGGPTSLGLPLWLYWAWPRLRPGRLGNFTQEQGPLLLTVESSTLGSAAEWSDGGNPYGEEPFGTGVELPAGVHWAFAETTVAPPAVTNGCVAYAAPGS